MYLVDTNVWPGRLLDQKSSDEVGRFLNLVHASELLISDFSFHSLGVAMDRRNRRSIPHYLTSSISRLTASPPRKQATVSAVILTPCFRSAPFRVSPAI